MTSRRQGVVSCAAALSIAAAFVVDARAQASLAPTSPQFANIARVAQEGYGDSARTLIAGVLARTPDTAASFVEALYTSGFVARTGDSMRSAYARVATDYSTSRWADKALVGLAQLDYGFGNMDRVVSDVTRLVSDYPSSPVLASGVLWGARAAFAQQKMQLGCGWLNKAIPAVGDDVELRNQLQFTRQSCDVGAGVQYAPANPDSLRRGPPPDSAAKPPAPAQPAPPPPAPSHTPTTTKTPAATASPWRVQVAAISDKAVIHRVQQKIEAAGFKSYLAPGPNGLTKIQAGPFATRAAAVAALPKVKAATGGSPIVVAAPQ